MLADWADFRVTPGQIHLICADSHPAPIIAVIGATARETGIRFVVFPVAALGEFAGFETSGFFHFSNIFVAHARFCGIDVVRAFVALFHARIHEVVAAFREFAGAQAAVGIESVAVVTFFTCIFRPVAADGRGDSAVATSTTGGRATIRCRSRRACGAGRKRVLQFAHTEVTAGVAVRGGYIG